jgi:hypothetical protein
MSQRNCPVVVATDMPTMKMKIRNQQALSFASTVVGLVYRK